MAENLRLIRASIAASAPGAPAVTVLAVSKGQPAGRIRAAAALGLTDIGESYVQEALPKMAELSDLALTWHFIGRTQANKTRSIAEHFDWVHSLDRWRIAERLAAQRPPLAPPLNVCVEVNIGADPSKGGVVPAGVPAFCSQLAALQPLRLRGLMCILPRDDDAALRRQWFAAMHQLFLAVRAQQPGLDVLSMGMSADYREAVAAGATMVRIGTGLFGERGASQRLP